MENLIQYRYSCEDAMFNYLKDGDLERLLAKLNWVEQLAMDSGLGTAPKSLWFKFGHQDTLATTIQDIKRDLTLPASHDNRKLIIEQFELVTNSLSPDNELRVYFS